MEVSTLRANRIGEQITKVIVLVCTLSACTSVAARTEQYRTYVAPTSDETMEKPCEYELTLRDTSHPVRAVFVVIERGWQVGNLYFDPEVAAFAEHFDLALVLARHCRAKTEEDMDVIPEHGVGRALLEALNHFALLSHRAELANSKIILFSFSGGGSFTARMVAYAPHRILAAVEYAPGHREPIGIDTVVLPEKALSVPQFIIANGADNICGTQRPFAYFEKYHSHAPLTFMVQNGVPHCCVMNVTHIVLLWLGEILERQNARTRVNANDSWRGFVKMSDSGVRDDWKESVRNVADAWIGQSRHGVPEDAKDAGWMPSKRFAEAWLAFEREREHAITPLE